MPIVLVCHCGKKLRARDEQAGLSCKCPACGTVLRVPYPMARPAPPPDEHDEPRALGDEDLACPPPPTAHGSDAARASSGRPAPSAGSRDQQRTPPTAPSHHQGDADDPLAQLRAAIAARRPAADPSRGRNGPGARAVGASNEEGLAGFNPPRPVAQVPSAQVVQQPGDIPEPLRGFRVIEPLNEKPPPRDLDLPPDERVQQRERTWRGHVYWLLLLFALPLVALTVAGKPDLEQALRKSLEKHGMTEEFQEQEDGGGGVKALDRHLQTLPGHRLEGALLARESWAHWSFAALAVAVYAVLVTSALPSENAAPRLLLASGAFTATLGVSLLLLIQYFGACLCIGLWYRAALDPRAPFGPSLLGFVLGVGVCEEIIKCIPVLWLIKRVPWEIGWREACLVGMASGAGFGISEGIHYSANFYNGLVGGDIYLVRFASSCGLHVLLSGACGIMIWRKQDQLDDWRDPYDWVIAMTAILLAPIFLHGLFDALLKKEYDAAAVGVWFASFALLAWLITSARAREARAAVARANPTGPKLVRTARGTRFVAE